jgi:gamma-glutamyl-gamma-aminobutyrate hydrolase PuuD/predicted ATP-grasp superfamily ATP-dependent carboligase
MSGPKPRGRVILTYGRSLMALVIARSLAQRGVEVIGCDDVGMTVLSFSKHVRETFTVAPWDKEPERYLDDLEAAVREYAPHDDRPYVLMPVFREISLIARHRDRFEPTIKLAAPATQSIGLVNPKHCLAELAEKHALDAPQTWRPENLDALRDLAPTLAYPVIVKPVDGAGGRGVSCVESAEEAEEKAAAIGFETPPLIQQCIDGEDYCVAVLAESGALKAIMAYKNVTTFPREAGAGAVRETVDAEPFRETTEKLVAAANWNGVAQIDFRWSGAPSDKPMLIEVNARFWAGIFHSVESGVDFPWLLYRQTIGLHVTEETDTHIGATTRTSGTWLLAAIEDVAASDPHFNAAADAWRAAKRNLKHGDLPRGLNNLRRALGRGLNAKAAATELRQTLSNLKHTPSELSEADDPLVGLGALFVLSSLVRHGKLPPEVTYKAEACPPSNDPAPILRKRPRIGITKPERGDLFSWWAMKFAVWLAGGQPVKVTARAPWDPHTIDGLIFGGGSDVYPQTYEGHPKPGYRYDLARGEMEASWAIAARRHDLPVLGVCRGAQMLNVLAGGTLHADLSGYRHVRRARTALGKLVLRKPIRIKRESKLASITECPERMGVNSIHEQAIDRLGAGLVITAREPNGVVQAIEDPTRRFWIGVQFHPELLVYRAPFRRLFKRLAEAARRRAEERVALHAPTNETGAEPIETPERALA